MAKLDKHADLVKRLYAETGKASVTHERLRESGVDVSKECVRQWLRRHRDELPMLREGGGAPISKEESQLFGFLDQNTKWMPDAGMHPQFFMLFHHQTDDALKDAYLAGFLKKFGIVTSLPKLEATELPLKQFRSMCDLELYLLAFLLGRHKPLIGTTEAEFVALTRAVTPQASALKEIILLRNTVAVGKLRELLRQAVAGCST